MKDRLPALDGLRGFAALSVVLGHASIWNLAANIPTLQTVLIALSAAHNAVQILFVLSGFLISYLYPVVPHKTAFIKKRYARIIPIYALVVVFLWTLTLTHFPWFINIVLLITLALAIKFFWNYVSKSNKARRIGTLIFYGFVVLQLLVLLFHIFIFQQHILPYNSALSPFLNSLLIMLTNLTLTTQLVKGVHQLSGVFWSLGPELLFYILYPFIVVPIIQIARRSSWIVTIFILLAITKVLLDLDNAVMSVASLNGINIARANGFVAGVTLGTIYQSQGKAWLALKRVATHPLFGLFALILLILVQLGEHIVGLGSIGFMNIFYLITSWLITIVILNAVIPNTLTQRIFRIKHLTFLGLISYSLYLIHETIQSFVPEIGNILRHFIASQKTFDIVNLLIYVGLSIIISYILFRFVEFLYFAGKKKVIATTQASLQEKTESTLLKPKLTSTTITLAITIIVFSLLYSGMYSPTLLIVRHQLSFSNLLIHNEKSLLEGSVTMPFVSRYNDLSVVGFDMRYGGSAGLSRLENRKHAQLRFELLSQNNTVLFSSVRDAFEVEGSPRFQFGFPAITDSKNKNYKVKLVLLDGNKDDNVFLDTSPTSFISIYKTNRSEFMKNVLYIIANRIIFLITNPNYIFVIIFTGMLVLLAKKGLQKNKQQNRKN